MIYLKWRARMPCLDIAYLHEQGQNVIIALLDTGFGEEASVDQRVAISDRQLASYRAGLRGRVLVVWATASGEKKFIAPREWDGFFRRRSLAEIITQVNITLRW
jgi:hypothetical protein